MSVFIPYRESFMDQQGFLSGLVNAIPKTIVGNNTSGHGTYPVSWFSNPRIPGTPDIGRLYVNFTKTFVEQFERFHYFKTPGGNVIVRQNGHYNMRGYKTCNYTDLIPAVYVITKSGISIRLGTSSQYLYPRESMEVESWTLATDLKTGRTGFKKFTQRTTWGYSGQDTFDILLPYREFCPLYSGEYMRAICYLLKDICERDVQSYFVRDGSKKFKVATTEDGKLVLRHPFIIGRPDDVVVVPDKAFIFYARLAEMAGDGVHQKPSFVSEVVDKLSDIFGCSISDVSAMKLQKDHIDSSENHDEPVVETVPEVKATVSVQNSATRDHCSFAKEIIKKLREGYKMRKVRPWIALNEDEEKFFTGLAEHGVNLETSGGINPPSWVDGEILSKFIEVREYYLKLADEQDVSL